MGRIWKLKDWFLLAAVKGPLDQIVFAAFSFLFLSLLWPAPVFSLECPEGSHMNKSLKLFDTALGKAFQASVCVIEFGFTTLVGFDEVVRFVNNCWKAAFHPLELEAQLQLEVWLLFAWVSCFLVECFPCHCQCPTGMSASFFDGLRIDVTRNILHSSREWNDE